MKRLIGAFLLFLAFQGSAQMPDRNEVLRQLEQAEDDSARAHLMDIIARTYTRQDKDSAIYYFNRSIALSSELGAPELTVHALNYRCMTYAIWGDMDSARISLLQAADVCQEHNLDSALHQVYFGLGNVLESSGDLTGALSYSLKALKYFEEHEMAKSAARTKANISYIYLKTDQPDKAYPLIKESNAYYASVGANRQLMNGFTRLGTIFTLRNQPDSTIYYLRKAAAFSKELGDPLSMNQINLNLGNALMDIGDFSEAIGKYEQVLDDSRPGNPSNMLEANLNLMLAHHYLGQHSQAQPYRRKAAEILPQVTEFKNLINYHQSLFKADSLAGNPLQAIGHYQTYISLKDSLFNQQKSRQLIEMETKYQTDQLAAEKELAQAESKQNRLLFIAASIVAVLILFGGFLYFRKQRQVRMAEMNALQLRESQKRLALEKQYRDSELKALKAQMNPHFIFNVLNSIQEFIVLNQKNEASDYLAMFAELIRSYLHYSNEGHISLREEVDSMEKYLELENLRFSDQLNYTIDVSPEIAAEEVRIPTMIIQPYVENAIKHGLFSKKDNRRLDVRFEPDGDGSLNCTITDNGIGRRKAQEIKDKQTQLHKSFAMEANASRLELFNQISKRKIGLAFDDLSDEQGSPSGTRVSLTIPTL